MNTALNSNQQKYFAQAKLHQKDHHCGAYPYEDVAYLIDIIKSLKLNKILEVGTGIGFTAFCMTDISKDILVDTIDQDAEHLQIAKNMWTEFGVVQQIRSLSDKAEVILPTLSPPYDLIFFDAYAPQMKFYQHFVRLLKQGGILYSANLYLKDPTGGRYLKNLMNTYRWETKLFADTAISIKH
jgi:predicted O-methyltransferase YrrM